jgi:hypothetical protein
VLNELKPQKKSLAEVEGRLSSRQNQVASLHSGLVLHRGLKGTDHDDDDDDDIQNDT